MVHRTDTWDINMLKENLKHCVYTNKIQLHKDDVWLDVGAHIGSFALSIRNVVKRVVCFEPAADSFDLLCRNLSLNDSATNIVPINMAVGAVKEWRTFYLNTKKNPGTNSFFVKRGRRPVEVEQTTLPDILNAYPAINKIKLDCEGSESELVPEILKLPQIKEVIMEFHFLAPAVRGVVKYSPKWYSKYNALVDQLKGRFSHVDYKPNPGKAWTTMVHARD